MLRHARPPRLEARHPDRPGPADAGPQPGGQDRRVRADDDIIDPRTGQERPGVERPAPRPVDGTYGGLAPPGQGDAGERVPRRTEAPPDAASSRATVPQREGPRAYTSEARRSDDPGAQPTGSTVQSGSGRADRS